MIFVFIVAGSILAVIAAVLLFQDCYRGYGSTPGGEMLTGMLWTGACLCAGAAGYLAFSKSLFRAAISFALMAVTWGCIRWLVVRMGTAFGKPVPTTLKAGFAEYIRREKELRLPSPDQQHLRK